MVPRDRAREEPNSARYLYCSPKLRTESLLPECCNHKAAEAKTGADEDSPCSRLSLKEGDTTKGVYWANLDGWSAMSGSARGKLRRVSSGPGAEACCSGTSPGPGAAPQAQKGVFWAWRRCEASEQLMLILSFRLLLSRATTESFGGLSHLRLPRLFDFV